MDDEEEDEEVVEDEVEDEDEDEEVVEGASRLTLRAAPPSSAVAAWRIATPAVVGSMAPECNTVLYGGGNDETAAGATRESGVK